MRRAQAPRRVHGLGFRVEGVALGIYWAAAKELTSSYHSPKPETLDPKP